MFIKFLKYLLAFLLVLASIDYLATSTTLGLQLGVLIINSFIPGHLVVENIKGQLSDFTLANINYSFDKDLYQFKNVTVSWNPEKLIDGRIDIADIKINEADINIHTSSDPSSEFSAESLQRLFIQKITAEKLNVTVNDKRIVHADHTEINRIIDDHRFTHMNNYSIQSALYDGNLSGTFNLTWSPMLSLKSSLKLTNLNLEKIGNKISGKINFGLQTNLVTNGLKYKLDLSVYKLNGNFRQYPVSGYTSLHLTNNTLEIQPSELKIANAYAKIYGRVKQSWDVQWNLNIPSFDILFPDIRGSLATSGYLSGEHNHPTIISKFQIPYLQLKKANPYLSEFKQSKADLTGKLSLSGSISNPTIIADMALTNGQTTLPNLGILLNKINLNSHYDNHSFNVKGSLQSGQGQGSLNGNIQLNPLQLGLELSGKALQAVNLAEYKITASPDINISYNPSQTTISGNIFIPYAEIKPIDLSGTTSLTDDVVFVNNEVKAPTIPSNFSLQTKIILGDAINVHYENLQARVKGQLSISQSPGRQPVATGQLNLIDGTYKAYGKLLTIQNGRIIYTGNLLSNPGLDINATRKIQTITLNNSSQFDNKALMQTYTGTDTVTVGVHIKGVVKKPILTLFSSAEMSQNNILSYLLFGYPQSELSGDSRLALLSAASSLKLGNVNLASITSKIQNLTGLSELNIESAPIFDTKTNTTQNQTMLSLGKKISDKLSVHYSMGINTSVTLLNIRYQISKQVLLQTETSYLENGVDLLYGFEKD